MSKHSIKIIMALITSLIVGCASKLSDVANPKAPTMKEVYEDHTGANPSQIVERHTLLMQRPALEPADQQLGLPPYPERLDHLYPRLPNPDLFMYVRPHAVGATGAPIPAYITRFSMYERQPYALPGETLDAVKIVTDFQIKEREERKKVSDRAVLISYERELFHE